MHDRGIIRVVLLVALVGFLAGCAATVPSPTPRPTRSAVASTPTPAATPASVAASAPGSRVPLGCGDLLGASSLSAIAGKAPHVYHDQNTPPADIQDLAQEQYGSLDCLWFHQGDSDTGAELEVDVAPDAQSTFAGRFAAIMAQQSPSKHPAATENVAGEQSGFWCADNVDALGADANLPICDGEMLVSGYWVSVEVDTVVGRSRAQLVEAIPLAMKDIATHLAAADAPPAQWIAPAMTLPAFCTAPTRTAVVRSIFGDSTLAAGTMPSFDAITATASTIGLVGPYAACEWSSKSYGYLQIRLLAGGSWAFPSFAPVPSGDSTVTKQDYRPLTVAGAASAKVACDGACDAFLAVGSIAAEVFFKDPGVGRRAAVLASFVKALQAD